MLNDTRLRNVYPYLCIALAVFAFYMFLGVFSHPQRIGDGMEYYAMYHAWDTTHTPWMTPSAFDGYQQLYLSAKINDLLPGDWLSRRFPSLRIGTTADFIHSWFYSFMAWGCSKIVLPLGVHLDTHESFLLLHFLLLTMTACIAYRTYQWRGVFVVSLMTIISPLLWFADKVHTEWFTCCLVLSSVMLILSKTYLPAALLLAVASTQNISFAPIACIPLFYRAVFRRDEPYTALDVLICVGTALILVVHPAYYFARFGVITPQLLSGEAAPGAHLSTFYIWIVDPDLGLLPNWPLGLIALLLAVAVWLFKKEHRMLDSDKRYAVFCVLYLLINLYAQSSTVNLNSGATPGLARYALWYLPLFFPIMYWLIGACNWGRGRFYVFLPIVLLLSLESVKQNDPRRHEEYLSPSRMSYFMQSRLPRMYNPPPEVFLERYSGFGETERANTVKAMIGPDCRKMLLLPGANKMRVMAPERCRFDPVRLEAYAGALLTQASVDTYFMLSEKDADALTVKQ